MLDNAIVRIILEKERRKREWQPEPLYLPVDDYEPLPDNVDNPKSKDEEDKEERGIVIIETAAYSSKIFYS